MKSFKNSKKSKFLDSIPKTSLDKDHDLLSERCKFNFHYMDFSQPEGQSFEDWEKDRLLAKLLDKLKHYSENSLLHWQKEKQRTSTRKKNHHVLEIYGDFPKKSAFELPKNVPHQALWARFRLENKVRLIGFVIPNEYSDKCHPKTKKRFDGNTFYAVFLDKNHLFYKTNK